MFRKGEGNVSFFGFWVLTGLGGIKDQGRGFPFVDISALHWRFWFGLVGVTGLVWRVAYCEPKHEFVARDIINSRGFFAWFLFERFLKRIKLRHQTRYAVQSQDRPLFPRYLFVDSDEPTAVTGVRGVLGLLSAGEQIWTVAENEMCRLRAMAAPNGMMSQTDITRLKYDLEGDVGDSFVFADNSPMFGLSGTISSIDRLQETGTIKALVHLFGRSSEAVVPYKSVGKILRSQERRVEMSVAA